MDSVSDLKALKLQAEIEYLNAQKEVEVLKARNYSREINMVEAGADGARIFTFYAPIMEGAVSKCMVDLGNWSRRFPGQDITVVFNSPGGSVTDGFALYDFLSELKRRGHFLTTKAIGMAASMGAIVLQAGDKRIIGRNSFLMIHEISAGTDGSLSQLEDNVKLFQKFQSKGLNILSERSSLSKAQIKTRWRRKDFWLDAEDSLKYGFVDEIS